MNAQTLDEILKKHQPYHNVVPFNSDNDKLLQLDFTSNNSDLNAALLCDKNLFTDYVFSKLSSAGAKYGIGGYNEHRTIYSRSEVFDDAAPTGSPHGGEPTAQSLLKQNDSTPLVAYDEGEFYEDADPMNYKLLKNFVAEHRSNPTPAEEFLWLQLKGKKLKGYKFRRQHIIGNFIADFVCLTKRLIIEVDGLIHQLPDHKISDEARTAWLMSKDFKVVGVTNDEVLLDTDQTLKRIFQELEETIPSPKKFYRNNNEFQTSLAGSVVSSPVGGSQMGAGAPRRLHLGIDIWGEANTPVYAPLEAVVHSFSFNDAFGDYGATLILKHELNGFIFHTLYGHLSLASIQDKQEGETIEKGAWIAAFGEWAENGNWPPHLHFQIIINMNDMKGDYPGVCQYAARENFLLNSPDPDLILQMMQYANN